MSQNMTGGQIVARWLAQASVEYVFCVPGESYLGVLDGLLDTRVRIVSARHEGGAAFMAEAYAKASHRVGVCMATRAVGAANLAIGLHTARQDSTPVVAILGQVERSFKNREAFQELPLDDWLAPVCKWTVEVQDVRRIPELMAQAFRVATSGRPGPVAVILPQDVVEESIAEADAQEHAGRGRTANTHGADPLALTMPGSVSVPGPDRDAVRRVHKAMCQANRPLWIAGGGVIRSGATGLLGEVAGRYDVPVVASFRRYDVIANDHPSYAGWLGFQTSRHVTDAVRDADYILCLGTRLSQVTSQNYDLLPSDVKVVYVDIDPLASGPAWVSGEVIQSDAGAFLRELADVHAEVGGVRPAAPAPEGRTQTLHDAWLAFSTPRLERLANAESDRPFVDLDALMADFSDLVPDDTIITSDAGNFFGWLARFYRFRKPGTYVGPTSGAMGYGLPAAIGAKLAHPERTVVSFSGDGGFMMTMAEMETATRLDLSMVSIVVNNHLYGTIRAHQERHFPGRMAGTKLGNPSFAVVAREFGAFGRRIRHNWEFRPALEAALAAGRLAVIEVMTDPAILSVTNADTNR